MMARANNQAVTWVPATATNFDGDGDCEGDDGGDDDEGEGAPGSTLLVPLATVTDF